MIKGGATSVFVTVTQYAVFGFDVYYIGLAFVNGMMWAAGISELINVTPASTKVAVTNAASNMTGVPGAFVRRILRAFTPAKNYW